MQKLPLHALQVFVLQVTHALLVSRVVSSSATLGLGLPCSDDEAVISHSASQPSLTSKHASAASLSSAAAESSAAATAVTDVSSSTPRASAVADSSAAAGDALSKKRAYKEKWQEGIALFNTKPKKGIAALQVRWLFWLSFNSQFMQHHAAPLERSWCC